MTNVTPGAEGNSGFRYNFCSAAAAIKRVLGPANFFSQAGLDLTQPRDRGLWKAK
jgi:hypothetical protein